MTRRVAKPGQRVAVFGGGPAGMTAAHELAERGFEVDLYERHEVLGGKVRSYSHPGTGTDGRPDLPGNSGGHFVMACYSGLRDTLSRIPIEGGRSVLDNLTTGPAGLDNTIAWEDATVTIPSGASFAPARLRKLATEGLKLGRMLTPMDVLILGSKVMALATSGEDRQWDELEHLSLDEYLEVDRLSPTAKKIVGTLVGGTTSADGLNTRATARILSLGGSSVIRRFSRGSKDRLSLFNGPETGAWFDPWARYLEGLGARFHRGHAVTSLSCERGRITSATVRDKNERESQVEADWYVLAVPPRQAAALMGQDLVAADPALGRIAQIQTFDGLCLQINLTRRLPELGMLFSTMSTPWDNANEVLTSAWNLDLTDYGDGKAAELITFQLTDAAWNRQPGMLYGKPAKDCSLPEIIAEVLAQLRRYVPDGERLFADEAIHSVNVWPGHVHGDNGSLSMDETMWAATPSCWENQPEPVTKVSNLFLAGSYTRNRTHYETMEGANESGRLAAQGVLAASGAPAVPVEVVSFSVPRALKILQKLDDRRYARGRANAFDVLARWPFRLASRRRDAVKHEPVPERQQTAQPTTGART